FVADRAMRSLLVVVSTPSLAFSPRVVEAHEPVCIQAFRSELTIEGFDEGIIGGLARSGEVQGDTPLVGPEVEIARNELSPLVDADRLRKSKLSADIFEDLDNIASTEVEPGFDRRRVAREGVDDRQHAQFPAGRELVVNEVHRPGLVRSRGRLP